MYKKIFFIACLFLFLVIGGDFVFAFVDAPGPSVYISEVGFKEEDDFIEIEVLVDGLQTFSVWEGGVRIAEIDADLESGDLMLIHEEDGEDVYIDGVYHVFGAGGLTGTDNIITLRDEFDEIFDTLIWSNNNGVFTGNSTVLDRVFDLDLWSCEGSSLSGDGFAWLDSDDVVRGESLQRIDGLSCDGYERAIASPGLLNNAQEAYEVHFDVPDDVFIGDEVEILAEGVFPSSDVEFVWFVHDERVADSQQFIFNPGHSGNFEVRLELVVRGGVVLEFSREISVLDNVYDHDFRISEVFPNPLGSDAEGEFVEIEYFGTHVADLSGYVLSDGSSEYYFNERDRFKGRFFVLTRQESGIALNNSNERVVLSDPNGLMVDSVEYEASFEGKSRGYVDGRYVWAKPSPGTVHKEDVIDDQFVEDVGIEDEVGVGGNFEIDAAVYISEFLPNPDGPDGENEWIELYNSENREIRLDGWSLDDGEGGSRPFTLDEFVLEPGGFLLLERQDSKIALNNASDHVRLLRPDGSIADQVFYEGSPEGASFARNNTGHFEWTSAVSPGAENVFVPVLSSLASKKVSAAKRSKNSSKEYQKLSLQKAMQLEKGDLVEVSGVVSVLPGFFSKKVFFIQDEDFGVQIYVSKGDVPEVAIGDRVTLRGKVSVAQDEKRILLSSADDISIISRDESVHFSFYSTSDASNQDLGAHVQIRGMLLKKEGSLLYLDDGSGVIKVFLSRGSEISAKNFTEGAEYIFEGVLRVRDGAVVVYAVTHQRVADDEVDDVSNEELVVESTPFYLQSWFSFLCVMIIVGVVYALYRWRKVVK